MKEVEGPQWIMGIPEGIGITQDGTSDTNRAAAMYLTLTAEKQGKIEGGITEKGQEKKIKVMGVMHGVISPRDPQSGLPTGKRRHGAIQIVIGLDKAIPKLWNVIVGNENIKDWKLEYWSAIHKGSASATAGSGHALLYHIDLVNGNLASMETITSLNGVILFMLSFTYQKITWTWKDGGITALDDWEAPVV